MPDGLATLTSPVRRWLAADIDTWLLGRLCEQWPSITEAMWRSRLVSFTRSNDCLFVCNDRGVLMASLRLNPVTLKQAVVECFAFSRDADKVAGEWAAKVNSKAEAGLLELYRAMIEWGHGLKAGEAFAGLVSDISNATLRKTFDGFSVVELPL